MRKKLLSLALDLALSLGLTVPTFAAGSEWKLEVPGKSNAEVFVGERTFTVRDWDLSQESRYNAEYDYEETVHIATKTGITTPPFPDLAASIRRKICMYCQRATRRYLPKAERVSLL